MIVACSQCGARYSFDESRFGDSSSKRLKCTQCGAIFTVHRPESEENGGTDTTTRGIEVQRPDRAGLAEAQAEPAPALSSGRRYSLAVILGANAGTIFTIERPRVVIGRGAECDLQLHDSEVSRRHAAVEVHGDEAVISDLGSTNGTFVEGARVDSARLSSHQEFSLGTTSLMFIVTELDDHLDDLAG